MPTDKNDNNDENNALGEQSSPGAIEDANLGDSGGNESNVLTSTEGEVSDDPKALLPVMLFIATLFTTVSAGAFFEGFNPFSGVSDGDFSDFFSKLSHGVPFSLSLLIILGVHEFGHFFAAMKHGVKTTYPYFIPGPPLPPMIGTFGAVIRVKSPIYTKKALIDIGAAGPLAGFVVALFVTTWGYMLSDIVPLNPNGGDHLGLGNSILLKGIELVTVGNIPSGYDIALHPIAFAGWIGLFITALNLMPLGQLDGGHMLYALVGKKHKKISISIALFLIGLGLVTWLGWAIWGAFVFFLGHGHPPVKDSLEELSKSSKIICLLSLIVFILTLIPTPFYIIGL